MQIICHRTVNWRNSCLLIFAASLSLIYAQFPDRPPNIVDQIRAVPDEVRANFGVSLSVNIHGISPLYYVWKQDGIVVQNDTRRYLDIQNAQVSNSGYYTCTGENVFGAVVSLPFKLSVKMLGKYTPGPDKTIDVEEGKFALLKPEQLSHLTDQFRVEWKLNDAILDTNPPNYHMSENNDLAILNIQASYDGQSYRVNFTHQNTIKSEWSISPAFILSVTNTGNEATFLPPVFVIRPENKTVLSGERDVSFECVINGRPLNNLQIKWYQGNGQSKNEIINSIKHVITSFGRVLTINNIAETDGGKYECHGSLTGQPTFSPISTEFLLIVQVKPNISPVLESSVTKDFQELFSLTCNVQGSPEPRVKWIFNGNVLSSGSSERYEVFPNGTLTIPSVDLPDSGVYQCMPFNEAGTTSSYTYLHVNSAKPEMIQGPEDTIVAEGENTELACKVKGGPQPEVYWTKDGVNLTLGWRIRKTDDGLELGQVKMSDSGLYACHAVNIKGTISVNATLSIIVKTTIIRPPQNMSKILNTDALLACGVRKDDSVEVTWRWYVYEGTAAKEIDTNSGNKKILPDGSLVIYGVLGSDSGKYKCTVTSDGGNDERVAILNVIDLPAAPTIQSVTLHEAKLSSVLIKWTLTYDGDTPIIKFVIQFRQESSLGANIDNQWETLNSNVDPSLRSFVVENLMPARYYRFRMIAVNTVGDSIPSKAVPVVEAIKMPSQPPGEAPKNLFCVQGDEREIKVEWESPPESSWNGELEGYRIFYKVDAFKDDTEKAQEVSGKDTKTFTLINLAYNKRYRIKIAAVNEKGAGVNSSAFHITTLQGKPSAPPNNVKLSTPNSTIINVQWDPPAQRLINGINLGYVIQVWSNLELKRTENVRFNEQNPTGKQSYNIINLSKYTEYEISVSCRTAPGPGPYSDRKSIRTLEDVPGPVLDLAIDNVRAKSLRVNWKPPKETNGVLKGYRIIYSVKNDEPAGQIFTEERGEDATSHTLYDLRYETTYIISVQAKTQVGYGPIRSTEIDSGVPPDLPGPASGLATSNIQARSVVLQFIQGYNGRTSILQWIIQAQVEDDPTWKEIYSISDPEAEKIEVQKLKPFTRYRLRIIKKNIVDFSEPSEPCKQFQTVQDVPGMPPENVTPRAVSSTAIRVRWKQILRTEWNGDYLGYRILYRMWSLDVDVNKTSPEDLALVRKSEWTTITLRDGSNIQEHTITGLDEWMDYEIKMVSFNAIGDSEPSPVLSEKTEEDVPNASPTNIRPSASSSTSVDISWSPVPFLQRNGNILGYKIKYKAQLPNYEAQILQVDGTDVLTAQLTDLLKFVKYDIQLLAFSRMGDGILSRVFPIRTAGDVPGPPVGIYFPDVTLTSATIKWQVPERPNGDIIAYRVAYRRSDELQSVMEGTAQDLTKEQQELKVERLDRETTYVFSVRAKTEDGWGEAATVEVYTFGNRDRPDAPSNVRVDLPAIKSRSVTIFWSPGNNNYGPVRSFIVQYKPEDGQWQSVDKTIGSDKSTFTITELKPNSVYIFRVAARNDIGTSDFSDESAEAQTDSDIPDGVPQNVQITALTRTAIKIMWAPPPKNTWNDDDLTGSIVEYREDRAEAFRSQPVNSGVFMANLEKLVEGMKYEIQVRVANIKGAGPPSLLQLFRVGDVAPSAAPFDVTAINKSSTEIELKFKAPPPDTTNGELTGYKVLFWESSTDVCTDTPDPSHRLVANSPTLLTNLRPFFIYCTTVQALNIAGEGPKSPAISTRTSEDLPGPPASLSFANITLQELTVLWEPPLVPNGTITHYELIYSVNNLESQKTERSTTQIEGHLRELEIKDLHEKSHYTFVLAAYTRIGRGEENSSTVVTGPQKGSPEAPFQLKLSSSQKSVYLTWVNQGEGYSPIYGYQIRLHEEGTPADEWSLIDRRMGRTPSARISLTNLKPLKSYRFHVRAINTHGISLPSPATEIYKTPSSSSPTTVQPDLETTKSVINHNFDCDITSLSVHVPVEKAPNSKLTLKDPSCELVSDGTHYVLHFKFDECGTSVSYFKDYIHITNTILVHKDFGPISLPIEFEADYNIPIKCSLKRETFIEGSFQTVTRPPVIEVDDGIIPDINDMHYELREFKTAAYEEEITEYPVKIPINKEVYFELSVNDPKPDIGIEIQSCVATPSEDPEDQVAFELIKNGCPATLAANNMASSTATKRRFRVQAFHFSGSINNHNTVYIHCQVKLCLPLVCSKPKCTERRRRRSLKRTKSRRSKVNGSHVYVSYGPLIRA